MHPQPLNPFAVGLSLKSQHYKDILSKNHTTDFFEAHIENYIAGGHHLHTLKTISENYPITLHGVALSLGGFTPPTPESLIERKKIIDEINPKIVSEHAACTYAGQHFNDLLPISLNSKTLQRICAHIDHTQGFLNRQILLENLSSYISFDDDTMSEADFLNEIAKRTGCGLLIDINNIYIQEFNLSRPALAFLDTINPDFVQQYHLAGGEYNAEYDMIIDTHGTDIPLDVMDLYHIATDKIGFRPTLYERDNNIPDFQTLYATLKNIKKTRHVLC